MIFIYKQFKQYYLYYATDNQNNSGYQINSNINKLAFNIALKP